MPGRGARNRMGSEKCPRFARGCNELSRAIFLGVSLVHTDSHAKPIGHFGAKGFLALFVLHEAEGGGGLSFVLLWVRGKTGGKPPAAARFALGGRLGGPQAKERLSLRQARILHRVFFGKHPILKKQ